jgi:hypothetical protein
MEGIEGQEKAESRARAVLRLVGTIALAAMALMIVVFAICWFVGWRTASQIGNALTWAGAVSIALGILSTFGGWGLTRNAQYLYVQSVSQETITERTHQALGDSLRSYRFTIVVACAGIVCLMVGSLL